MTQSSNDERVARYADAIVEALVPWLTSVFSAVEDAGRRKVAMDVIECIGPLVENGNTDPVLAVADDEQAEPRAAVKRVRGALVSTALSRMDAAEDKIAAALALHRDEYGSCAECTNASSVIWPCPTAMALGASDTERIGLRDEVRTYHDRAMAAEAEAALQTAKVDRLNAEVESLTLRGGYELGEMRYRAEQAEARVARVDALADKWSAAYEVQHRTEGPTVAQIQLGRMAEALKVALDVSAPATCGRCGEPSLGYATIGRVRYCHADERSCYTEQCRDASVSDASPEAR